MHQFITIKEVASRYRVSVATLYSWLKSGKFPAGIRIGGLRRWDIQELEAFERNSHVQQ